MSSRRIAVWWRLLLAVGLLAMPVASAAAAVPGAAHVATRHGPATATVQASPAIVSTAPASGLHRTRHVHRTAPMLAAVAAVGVALLVFLAGSGVVRRRASQLAGVHRRWWSSRAPPSGTSSLVPFGHPSGRAGRPSRSLRALFSGPIPSHC